jgi:DNA repair protein RadC
MCELVSCQLCANSKFFCFFKFKKSSYSTICEVTLVLRSRRILRNKFLKRRATAFTLYLQSGSFQGCDFVLSTVLKFNDNEIEYEEWYSNHRCHVGALNSNLVYPREVFKAAI